MGEKGGCDLAKDRDYSYDGLGNRVSSGDSAQQIAYTPDALNQYDQITTTPTGGSATTVTKVHDDDGNLTDDGSKLYEWDAENRLVALRRKSDNLLIAKYQYDYLSRRIYKETSSIAAQGATTHIFTYEGWNLCAEYEASAINGTTNAAITSLKRTYTWGTDLSGSLQGAGGVGGLLAVEEKSGTHAGVYYPLYDGNGNVTEIVKEASGGAATLVAHYEYDPFGNLTVEQNSDSSGYVSEFPHLFSTKYRDEESGLYYYGYRYYDPVTGRWPSRDHIGERGGFNLYGMVGNDTVNLLDYLGLLNIKPSKSTWGLGVYDFSDLTGQRMEIPLDGKSSKKRYENLAEIRKRASMVSEDSLNMAGFKGAKLSHEAMMRGPRAGTQKRGFRQMVEYGGRVCCNSETNKYTITGPYTSGDNNHLDDFGAYHPSSLEGDDRYVVLPPNIDDALPGRMSEIYPEVEVTEADQEGKLVTYLVRKIPKIAFAPCPRGTFQVGSIHTHPSGASPGISDRHFAKSSRRSQFVAGHDLDFNVRVTHINIEGKETKFKPNGTLPN